MPPDSINTLPPVREARTSGIFREKRTFPLQIFALSRVAGDGTVKPATTQKSRGAATLRLLRPGFCYLVTFRLLS